MLKPHRRRTTTKARSAAMAAVANLKKLAPVVNEKDKEDDDQKATADSKNVVDSDDSEEDGVRKPTASKNIVNSEEDTGDDDPLASLLLQKKKAASEAFFKEAPLNVIERLSAEVVSFQKMHDFIGESCRFKEQEEAKMANNELNHAKMLLLFVINIELDIIKEDALEGKLDDFSKRKMEILKLRDEYESNATGMSSSSPTAATRTTNAPPKTTETTNTTPTTAGTTNTPSDSTTEESEAPLPKVASAENPLTTNITSTYPESNTAGDANWARRRKQADMTFMELYKQRENEAEFLRLLTQTQRGKAYPINHSHSGLRCTLLHAACAYNLPSVVEAILSRKDVDVNLQGTGPKDGVPTFPLCTACSEGNLECVKLLCQAPGIDLNAESAARGTPLSAAAFFGRRAVVKYLLTEIPDGKIEYNAIDSACSTAFMEAIRGGHKRVVKMFLDDKRIHHHYHDSTDGRNAMDMACWAGSPTLIRLLEEKGFAPPTDPMKFTLEGRMFTAYHKQEKEKILTERRALAEDYVLREARKSCDSCRKQFKRKELERCSNCLGVWYCGQKCQKADWKCHKPHCFEKIP